MNRDVNKVCKELIETTNQLDYIRDCIDKIQNLENYEDLDFEMIESIYKIDKPGFKHSLLSYIENLEKLLVGEYSLHTELLKQLLKE
jgi:hypothetical protein